MDEPWWKSAVVYQIYPRSFADHDGDGVGSLPGVRAKLDHLAWLGVDALWLSPFYPSPMADFGYDVADYCAVDPLFGTLADFDGLVADAHDRGIRVIVDWVPNHSSDQHPWFLDARSSRTAEHRDWYVWREPTADGAPPNNWIRAWGGEPAWTLDPATNQWYLHLFLPEQPDLNWNNPEVRAAMADVLRFWLDRGVDGFRVDVAHGMIKAAGLPDYTPPPEGGSMGGGTATLEPEISSEPPATAPYWAQDGVHEIYRDWHILLAEYPGDRVLAAEAWVDPLSEVAKWVRPDEMHQAFNFAYLETPWNATALRGVIDDSLEAFSAVGAPSTWVLSNHDVVRHASRLALTAENLQGHGIGPKSVGLPDPVLGLRRARAATALMLALPGSSYLYQGEELGLPEVVDLPDSARQDPTWFRTNGERYGRDGCRVPIPWTADGASYGFGPTAASWLPQPREWALLARDLQVGVPGSTLELYRLALRLRREFALGTGAVDWLSGFADEIVAFRNGDVIILANTGSASVELPAGDLLLASEPLTGRTLPGDTTAWLRA